MAKAKIVTKERKPRKPASFVRLTLTFEEALTLSGVCGMIGGTFETPRKDMFNIGSALVDIGVEPPEYLVDPTQDTIYFLSP
jgi:hypothetical protein